MLVVPAQGPTQCMQRQGMVRARIKYESLLVATCNDLLAQSEVGKAPGGPACHFIR